MNSLKGYLLLIGALVLCPCHLPILAAVFAGTGLGWAITDHSALLVPVMGGLFIAALVLSLRSLTRDEVPACSSCETPNATAADQKDGATRSEAPSGMEARGAVHSRAREAVR